MKRSFLAAPLAIAAIALSACSTTEAQDGAGPEYRLGTGAGTSTTAQTSGSGTGGAAWSGTKLGSQLGGQNAAPAPQSCGTLTGRQAAEKWVGQVPTENGWAWNTDYAYVDGYDPCAALSWIVLPIEGGTSSSPYQIMLFHKGEFLGTATAKAYGFSPEITRVDDATLAVTYRFAHPGDTNANPTGRAEATFTWDAAQNKVVMSGQTPDDVRNGGTAPAPAPAPSANNAQIGGFCATTADGWDVEAGDSTSCAFAMATVDELAKIGKPEPSTHAPLIQVYSPVTGQTYTMDCRRGSDSHTITCEDANGGTAYVTWSKWRMATGG